MGRVIRIITISILLISIVIPASWAAEPIIIDHACTDITKIPQAAIERAKARLHIAYGHSTHGNQLTAGMTGLVAFANSGGLGLALPEDIFCLERWRRRRGIGSSRWRHGGQHGRLSPMGHQHQELSGQSGQQQGKCRDLVLV